MARCEHCGGNELLDVGGAQHPVYLTMMGAAALGDGVEVGRDSGPSVLPVPGAQLVQVIGDQDEGPLAAASSASTLSTMAWPLNSGAAGRGSAPPVAARTAPGSAS